MRTGTAGRALARRRYERHMRALGWRGWWPMRARSGAIARNLMYVTLPGADLLTDGAMENWLSATNLTSWTEAVAGTSTVNREATTIHGGTYATRFDIDALFSSAAITSAALTGLGLGDTLRIEGYHQRSAAGIQWKWGLGGSTKVQNIDPGDAYALYSRDYINDAAANPTWFIQRQGNAADASKSMYFDDFSIRKVGELDAAIAGTTSLAQSGARGVSEAFLLDGATSLLTVINRASIQGLTEFSLWMLFNPSSAGELNAGVLFSKAGEFELRFNSASRDLIASVEYSTSPGSATTSTTLAANAWHTVGLRIDNTGKSPEIFIDGVEAAYAAGPTAGVGTRVSNTNALISGNNVGVTGTLAGLLDEAALMGRALTDAEFRYLHGMVA